MAKESVLITGSGKGLGKELALIFADNGHNVIINGRTERDLEELKSKILQYGVECYAVQGDLRYKKTIDKLYNAAKKADIGILINNAGVMCPSLPFHEIPTEKLEEILTTNFLVPVRLSKKIYPLFLEKGYGCIININSIIGLEPKELRSISTAAKWGLRGFTSSLRLEAEKNNIKVMGIYPTGIKTRSEYEWGMDPSEVAKKIYETYENGEPDFLIMDGRPEKFKPEKRMEEG